MTESRGQGPRAYVTLDVFTHTAFTGNPLAIVEDARGLSAAQMLAITREFNLSETVFVLPPEAEGHEARIRIFYPGGEMPFAGHPTIGAALHLAWSRHGEAFEGTLVLEEQIGPVPVRVWREAGRSLAELSVARLPRRLEMEVAAADCAQALGLEPAQIGAHRPGVIEGGPTFLCVPLRDLEALAQARPIQPQFDALQTRLGCMGLYLYAPGGQGDYQARMFDPMGGIPEDPATGSATALLAAQLLENGALAEGETRLRLRQGVEMGRPSDLGLRVEITAGALRGVHVSGGAVPIAQGMIAIPQA